MASFRIHTDQENRQDNNIRQKQDNVVAMAAKEKRAVLGIIDRNNKAVIGQARGKQQSKDLPLKSNVQDEVDPTSKKDKKKNLIAPVVPVAQFEAFKVYEDEENMVKIDQKLRLLSKSNVYKGTAEDRFITKAELAERERQKIEKENMASSKEEEIPMNISAGSEAQPGTPMSIEKVTDENNVSIPEILPRGVSSARETFFQIEEYREDIYSYLREHELRHRAKPGYIVKQPDVSENMRAILVDWLVEVTEEYKMQTETLYLAVNFIDRFLSYMSVVRAKLQLVGTAAMFIASKYEEIFPPDVTEFVYITDDTYDKRQVIRMEHLILRVLGFDLSVPTPLTFINAISISCEVPDKVVFLAMYLSELTLLDVEPLLNFLPSTIAASAIALARHTLGELPWNESFAKNTGYSLSQLKTCISFLYDIFLRAPSNAQHAIQDKYKSGKYMQVSKLVPNNKVILFDN